MEQPEGEGHSQNQHWKLQASVQKTFHKDVTSMKAVLEEMGILRTENKKFFLKSLQISKKIFLEYIYPIGRGHIIVW